MASVDRNSSMGARLALLGGSSVVAVLVVACQPAASVAGPQALSAADVARCQALKGKTLGGAEISNAQPVAVGEKGGANLIGSTKAIVPFCRVDAVGSSGPGSSIKLQVLLPATWNGKLVGVGGGGLSGGLPGSVGGLMRELARGYAGVANDAGHTDAKKAAWGMGSPARIEDFGFRANHVALLAAKAIAADYFGKPVDRSYFSGCSNGGREALMLAQRYPDDYDGIIAGAPAINWTGLMASAQANHQLVQQKAKQLPSKLAMVRAAVIRKCDMLDGVADDVLENPLACQFDPAELQCKAGAASASCLTKDEVDVVRAIYRGPRTSDGQRIISGYALSSEHGKSLLPLVGWAPWFMRVPNAGVNLSIDYYRGIVSQNLEWDPKGFQLDRDFALAKARAGAATDALDPDLRPLANHRAKLIIFQGWEDPAIPANGTVEYYDAVRGRLGAQADSTVRLFMAPGMAHCSLGHGPDQIDVVPVLDSWVMSGKAPESILATKVDSNVAQGFGLKVKVIRTRPLCPWPATAHYKGSGSTDAAKNFFCKADASAAGS